MTRHSVCRAFILMGSLCVLSGTQAEAQSPAPVRRFTIHNASNLQLTEIKLRPSGRLAWDSPVGSGILNQGQRINLTLNQNAICTLDFMLTYAGNTIEYLPRSNVCEQSEFSTGSPGTMWLQVHNRTTSSITGARARPGTSPWNRIAINRIAPGSSGWIGVPAVEEDKFKDALCGRKMDFTLDDGKRVILDDVLTCRENINIIEANTVNLAEFVVANEGNVSVSRFSTNRIGQDAWVSYPQMDVGGQGKHVADLQFGCLRNFKIEFADGSNQHLSSIDICDVAYVPFRNPVPASPPPQTYAAPRSLAPRPQYCSISDATKREFQNEAGSIIAGSPVQATVAAGCIVGVSSYDEASLQGFLAEGGAASACIYAGCSAYSIISSYTGAECRSTAFKILRLQMQARAIDLAMKNSGC